MLRSSKDLTYFKAEMSAAHICHMSMNYSLIYLVGVQHVR